MSDFGNPIEIQRGAAAELLAWMLVRMDDLIATYPAITAREVVDAVHHCAKAERPDLVARLNSTGDP